MNCPKCGQQNPDPARFCRRCHATLRYSCPACSHEQKHGGTCEKCGVDFVKYAAVLVGRERQQIENERERFQHRSDYWKSLLLAPFTSGFSILKLLLSRDRD